ncbi:MAG: hypothetical protein R3324_10550 [Halobacteriales archaeon]|nr:hypothetical protein [Halobacteriales archaeon]
MLTSESVRSFVETYERTYRYNEMLAEYPEKIGRLNDVDVSILEVTVDTDDGTFTTNVSGQVNTGITTDGSDEGTPTQTPLPMGHLPFDVSYAVSERLVERKGVVYECW